MMTEEEKGIAVHSRRNDVRGAEGFASVYMAGQFCRIHVHDVCLIATTGPSCFAGNGDIRVSSVHQLARDWIDRGQRKPDPGEAGAGAPN